MLDTNVYGDATAEEIRALGYDPDDMWGRPSPWELGNKLGELRKRGVAEKEAATWVIPEIEQSAEEGPVVLSEEELAEVYAQLEAEAERTEEAPAAIGRNGLVLINDPDWVDMTDRNWDYMRHVYQSSLSHRDKTVLGVVAMHCGLNSLGCSTSNETLAKEANIDKDNLRKRLSVLTKDGWVRENGMMPPVRDGMSGTKIRHIGVKKEWIQGGSQ